MAVNKCHSLHLCSGYGSLRFLHSIGSKRMAFSRGSRMNGKGSTGVGGGVYISLLYRVSNGLAHIKSALGSNPGSKTQTPSAPQWHASGGLAIRGGAPCGLCLSQDQEAEKARPFQHQQANVSLPIARAQTILGSSVGWEWESPILQSESDLFFLPANEAEPPLRCPVGRLFPMLSLHESLPRGLRWMTSHLCAVAPNGGARGRRMKQVLFFIGAVLCAQVLLLACCPCLREGSSPPPSKGHAQRLTCMCPGRGWSLLVTEVMPQAWLPLLPTPP